VRLRGRFTLGFAAAALVPIVVAALVTREVVTGSYRDAYYNARLAIDQSTRDGVLAQETAIERKLAGLADRDNPLVGGLLAEMGKGDRELAARVRLLKDEGSNQLRTNDADVITITAPGDTVLYSPHDRAAVEDVDPAPMDLARRLPWRAFFVV
jgi:hypothetical protein